MSYERCIVDARWQLRDLHDDTSGRETHHSTDDREKHLTVLHESRSTFQHSGPQTDHTELVQQLPSTEDSTSCAASWEVAIN